MPNPFRALARWLNRGDPADTAERELEDELHFHIEMATARNIRQGLAPDEARRRALLAFGAVEDVKARVRGVRRSRWIDGLAHDFRYAARSLRKHPGFGVAVILTAALGIGGATAIFSVINGVLLRPLPFPDADRIAYVAWNYGDGRWIGALSATQFNFLREHAAGLEGVTTYRTFGADWGERGSFETVRGLRVSHDFFRVTGMAPVLGRAFTADDQREGAADVVILGHALWRARFGADPGILGGRVPIGETTYTVVGVMPETFRFPDTPDATDLLVPLHLSPDAAGNGQNWITLARRRAGWNGERAADDLSRVSAALADAFPTGNEAPVGHYRTSSFQEVFVGDLRTTLWVLLGAVTLVLLIACANGASLVLARSASRQREQAVRAALGAGRLRIARQLLTETLVLSLLAGIIGLAVGQWSLHAMLALAPRSLPRVAEIGLDGRVLAFALAVSTLSGVVFGLSGARLGGRVRLVDTLRSGGRGILGPRRSLELLVMGETAFAVVLLTGAGLLISSFARLRAVDPGFEPAGVLAVRLASLPDRYAGGERIVGFEARVLERIRALPGVEGAAGVSNFPLERGINLPMTIAGRPDEREGSVEWRGITPGYFETLRIPIVRGRAFTAADRAGGPKVAIVNEAFAARYWPDRDPIGERIEIGRWKDEWLGPEFVGGEEIVAVAADVKEIGLGVEARRTVYVPRAQAPGGMLDNPRLVVRAGRPAAAEAAIVEAIRTLDPEVRPPTVRLLDDVVGASIAQPRFQTLLLAIFAGVALALTAFGIYAVIAYSVNRRIPEIGVRLALGSTRGGVLRLVLRRAMVPVGIGLVLGIGAALALTRLLASMLYGITPTDPLTFAAVAAAFLLVGLVAALVPAQRASRVPPTVSLSAE